jgi:hypothetical protein
VPHVVLLGDSIFDNAAYVPRGATVIDHLRGALPPAWRATLGARDGSVIDGVHGQLSALPDDASHLVLSVGGNDLLAHLSVLDQAVRTVGEGLRRLAAVRDRFHRDYERLLAAIVLRGLPAVVCTVYNPRFPDPGAQTEAMTALSLFNDAIVRLARPSALPVLELRAVCTDDADYATPIEPSARGGARLAQAIRSAVVDHDFRSRRTVLLP